MEEALHLLLRRLSHDRDRVSRLTNCSIWQDLLQLQIDGSREIFEAYLKKHRELLGVGIPRIDGDREIVPGIRALRIKGHNDTIQSFAFESEGARGFYFADTLPMTPHVAVPWVMGYDLYPHELTEAKKRLLAAAVDERRLCVFEHVPSIPWGVIVEDAPGKRRVEAVPPDAPVFAPPVAAGS